MHLFQGRRHFVQVSDPIYMWYNKRFCWLHGDWWSLGGISQTLTVRGGWLQELEVAGYIVPAVRKEGETVSSAQLTSPWGGRSSAHSAMPPVFRVSLPTLQLVQSFTGMSRGYHLPRCWLVDSQCWPSHRVTVETLKQQSWTPWCFYLSEAAGFWWRQWETSYCMLLSLS